MSESFRIRTGNSVRSFCWIAFNIDSVVVSVVVVLLVSEEAGIEEIKIRVDYDRLWATVCI